MIRIYFLLAAILTSCNRNENAAELTKLNKRIDSLQQEAKRIEDVAYNVNGLISDKWAKTLRPEDGYLIIESDIGLPLSFKMNDISDYAGGSRIIISVGNSSSIAISNVSGDILCIPKNGESHSLGKVDFGDRINAGVLGFKNIYCPDMPSNNLKGVRISGVEIKSGFWH